MTHLRIDPVEHILIARWYLTTIDPTIPLDEMTEPYITVATIAVARDTAYVQGVHGQLSRAMIDATFAALAKNYGVERMTWRRQYPDGRAEDVLKVRDVQ